MHQIPLTVTPATGVEQQLDMLGCVLSSVWRNTAGCADVVRAMADAPPQLQPQPQQPQQQQQQQQQHVPFLLEALDSLAQDVGHARALLDQVHAKVQGSCAAGPLPPTLARSAHHGSSSGVASKAAAAQQVDQKTASEAGSPGVGARLGHASAGGAMSLAATPRSSGRGSPAAGGALAGLAAIQHLMQQLGAGGDQPRPVGGGLGSHALCCTCSSWALWTCVRVCVCVKREFVYSKGTYRQSHKCSQAQHRAQEHTRVHIHAHACVRPHACAYMHVKVHLCMHMHVQARMRLLLCTHARANKLSRARSIAG